MIELPKKKYNNIICHSSLYIFLTTISVLPLDRLVQQTFTKGLVPHLVDGVPGLANPVDEEYSQNIQEI
jgi:hypothetical protein